MALGKTVGQLLDEIDSRELSEWLAYYQIEPFGEERADLRAGIIAATTANVWAKKGKSYKPADFMHDFEPPRTTPVAGLIEKIKGTFQGLADLAKRTPNQSK